MSEVTTNRNLSDRIPSNVQASIDGCVAHAADLLTAAKTVLAQKLPHIAYHLATLSLEEIGKAGIIGMTHIATEDGVYPSWMGKHADDHVKKLFWAIWGPSFGKNLITNEQIQEIQGLAQAIHEKRLQGLYVDIDVASQNFPKDAVSPTDSENLIALVEARIGMAQHESPKDLNQDEKADLLWFISATDDPEKRRIILGRKSMEKLVEFGYVTLWIKWLHEQFEQADKESKEILEKELNRSREPRDSDKDKWKLRISLRTNSHKLRGKDLRFWNQSVKWIKIILGNQKDELLVDINLPALIPLDSLYWSGWGACRRFVCALNIGSFGYFWWYIPEQIATYADFIVDIENNARIKAERNPVLKIDWGKMALDEKVWESVQLAVVFLPYPSEKEKHEPFNHYLTGLGFLSKTDVHMQFEPNAYDEFFKALKSGMKIYGSWDGKAAFEDAFNKFLIGLIPSFTDSERKKLLDLGNQFEKGKPQTGLLPITLSEVGEIKIICDAYFNRVFRDMANARAKKDKVNKDS